jgi:hypothetical protein
VRSSGDRVALKRLAPADPEQLREARAEAALLTALDHPNLVRLHRFVVVPGAAVLVLDLAAGGSLAALLAARGRLTPGETITALAPIGAALAYAHRNGVIHGDVTPANILFDERGLPLLADLGVARLLSSSAPARTTPAYIDPAVAAGAAPGPATDVFMLAASAVHALTGSPLWEAETSDAALALAAAGDTGAAADRLDAVGVPEPMVAVVTRALSVEPPLRGTAADFALDLRHSGEPVAVELRAGRERRPARHAAHATASAPARRAVRPGRHAEGAESGVGRSVFVRPAPVAVVAQNPELTHGARLRAPVLPRPRRRPARGRLLLLFAGCALALAVAAALLAWPAGGAAHRAVARASPSAVAPATRIPAAPLTTVRATTARAPATPPTPTRPTATESLRPGPPSTIGERAIAAVLARLDGLRARAFATRNPHLLGGVYVAGPLLARDTALLTSIVPAGCGLRGARTSYRDLAVTSRTSTRVAVVVRATLARGSLRCAGAPRRATAGAGPVTLHITLAQGAAGYRIAAQSR